MAEKRKRGDRDGQTEPTRTGPDEGELRRQAGAGAADAFGGPGPEGGAGSPAPEGGAEDEPRDEGAEAAAAGAGSLQHALAERDELRDRWLRAVAELDNVRKRARREVEEAHRYGQADLLRDLVEVLDAFGLAVRSLESLAAGEGDGEAVRAGLELIDQRLREILGARGLEPIPALGETFDPAWHEAVGQVEAEGVPSGQVVEVLQDGYRLRDRVLRPSRVVVAR